MFQFYCIILFRTKLLVLKLAGSLSQGNNIHIRRPGRHTNAMHAIETPLRHYIRGEGIVNEIKYFYNRVENSVFLTRMADFSTKLD